MSPELLDPKSFGLDRIRPTKESDCYALGMVVYEVLSGQTPFVSDGPAVVIRKVLSRERPGRPRGAKGSLFTDSIWRALELCWKHQPRDRLRAKAVLQGLRGHPPTLRPLSSTEVDGETDTDDLSDTTASDSGTFSLVYPWHIFSHPYITIGLLENPRERGIADRWAQGAGKIFKTAVGELRKPWRATQ